MNMKYKPKHRRSILSRITWLLTAFGIIFICLGLYILLSPIIQNMLSIRDQERALSDWKVNAEEYTEKLNEIKEEQNIGLQEEEQPATFPLRLLIPSLRLDVIVSEGTDKEALKNGPGHIIGTSYPGEIGTVAISGHRTTYGAPFANLDKLKPGDEILLIALYATYIYEVTELRIVKPADNQVLDPTPYPSLVLTTCHPKYSARERLIVFAKMIEESENK